MSSRKNKVNTKESRKDSRKNPKKESLSRKESRKDPKKEESRKDPRKESRKNSKKESKKDVKKESKRNSRKESSRKESSRKQSSKKESSKKELKKLPKQTRKLKAKTYSTNAHYQHPRHVENQTVNTRSVTKAQEEFLARIHRLANDPDCLKAVEAFNLPSIEKDVRDEENVGKIQLHVIGNSATQPVEDATLSWLVGLQNIFSEGLIKMDRSYISKVVFDPRHKSIVIVEKNNVIGGICFRMFPMHQFTEIIFIAVSITKHRQGYGTHMLNHLKDYLVSKDNFLMVTYAAEEAHEFFRKQGFIEPEPVLEPELEPIYTRYINVYQGATLMECRLEKGIPYTEFSEVVCRQRKVLKRLIEQFNASCST